MDCRDKPGNDDGGGGDVLGCVWEQKSPLARG